MLPILSPHNRMALQNHKEVLLTITAAQHSVHPTGGSLRVFRRFVSLEAGSVKMALPHPAHQPVTPTVGC
jgi:hypothetical protein